MSSDSISNISGIQTAATHQKIGMAVLKKTLDTQKIQGQAIIELIKEADPAAAKNQSGGSGKLDITI